MVPRLRTIGLLLVAISVGVSALDNGLGKLPGLGWNSDYCTNCSGPLGSTGYGDEVFVKHIADYMHTEKQSNGKTLQELGFHYVNMDASWVSAHSANFSRSNDPCA